MNTETITTASPDNKAVKTASPRVRQSERNVPQSVKDAVMARAMMTGDMEAAKTLMGNVVAAKTAYYLNSPEFAEFLNNEGEAATKELRKQLTVKLHKLVKDHPADKVAAILIDHARSLITGREFAAILAELEN